MRYTEGFLKIAVVDDEGYWCERAKNVIRGFYKSEDMAIRSFSKGNHLLERNDFYDVVFLDIEMEGLDGFETAKQYRKMYPKTKIVFLTSHEEMSRKGYVVQAFRYILKNQMENEIPEALRAAQQLKNDRQCITILTQDNQTLLLVAEDIAYVRAYNRRIIFYTKKGKFVSRMTLQEVEDVLGPYGFYRSHRAFLVNLSYVRNYTRTEIILKDQSEVFLSCKKSAEFRKVLLEYQYIAANA